MPCFTNCRSCPLSSHLQPQQRNQEAELDALLAADSGSDDDGIKSSTARTVTHFEAILNDLMAKELGGRSFSGGASDTSAHSAGRQWL